MVHEAAQPKSKKPTTNAAKAKREEMLKAHAAEKEKENKDNQTGDGKA